MNHCLSLSGKATKCRKREKNTEWVESATVQSVEADVTTKWQRYAKDGPLHYVPINKVEDDVLLDLLKYMIAAKRNLWSLMESDRGPLSEEKSQLKLTKIIHVRCLSECRSLKLKGNQREFSGKREYQSMKVEKFVVKVQRTVSVDLTKEDKPKSSTVVKSVMKRKLALPSVNSSKLMNLGKNLPITKSKTRNFPMKILEFKFENGNGTWGGT
jgi:hypothetical protein